MSRFQQGSLFKLERKSRPDVWVFRWYDNSSGSRRYKKQIIGSVIELRNRREAERSVIALRSSINADVGTPRCVCDLAAHYRLHELTVKKRPFQQLKAIDSCLSATLNPAGDTSGSALFERFRSRNGWILLCWHQVRRRN